MSVSVCVCVQSLIAPRPDVARSPNFAYPKNLRPGICRYLARNSTTLPSGGNSASSRFSWRKVWNGVKCNLSSAHLHVRTIVGKLSIRRVRMWNFTWIGCKTKKLWLSIILARRPSEQPGLGPPQKRCELPLFFAAIQQAVRRWEALDLKSLNMQFQQDWPKDKKLQLFVFARKLRKNSRDWTLWRASRGSDHISLSQLYIPYVFGKLSISWAEICIFKQDKT